MPNAGRSVIRLLAPVSVTTRFASAENSYGENRTANIVICGLLAVQSSWILPAGLLLAYPVPVLGDWVGEAIKLRRPSISGYSYKLEECCCQFCVALKPLSLHWVS